MVELAQVLYQQATCEGWSSSNWMLYLMMHYHLAALQNASLQTLAPPELHSKLIGRSIISAVLVLLAKWKWRSITGCGRWSSRSTALTVSCHGLSCEHTLSSHAAIFHSAWAFASSPTVLARTGAAHATAKPSIRALQDLKQVCHWELLKFNCAGDVRRVGHMHVHTGNPVVQTNIGPFNSSLYKCRF